MTKTIAKLNKLNHPESFIQINILKGFKYIDRAGEVVNSYHKNDAPPQFSMGLNGLDIIEPLQKVSQLKLTAQTFWMKFEEIDSLDMVSGIFVKEAEKISKILDVQEVGRIGWRNYFYFDFKTEEDQKKYLQKFTVIEDTNPVLMRLEIKTGKDFNANLMLKPVIKNDTDKTRGVLFDVDVFKNGNTKIGDISKILKSFREYLADESGFLSLINETF